MCVWVHESRGDSISPPVVNSLGHNLLPVTQLPVSSLPPRRALPATVTHGDRWVLHVASLPWGQHPLTVPGCSLCGCPWHPLSFSHPPTVSNPTWRPSFLSLS